MTASTDDRSATSSLSWWSVPPRTNCGRRTATSHLRDRTYARHGRPRAGRGGEQQEYGHGGHGPGQARRQEEAAEPGDGDDAGEHGAGGVQRRQRGGAAG